MPLGKKSKSTVTVKGHMNQQRMCARSIKIKEEEDCNNEAGTALDTGVKTYYVYTATIHTEQIYTDQTGRFPVVSSKVKKYIMVLYEYDGNAIMVEPIKNITAMELLRAFQFMKQNIIARGLKPRLVRLDNEASQLLNIYLYEQDISFQLIPSYIHRQNLAERAIISFKDHLIVGLCSTDKSFPMYIWDRLLPYALITLNMIRTSRINPKLSASTHLDGQYSYNRAPMAPPGTRIIAYETPNFRRTWSPRGQYGW
jgi:hypothetical protein